MIILMEHTANAKTETLKRQKDQQAVIDIYNGGTRKEIGKTLFYSIIET